MKGIGVAGNIIIDNIYGIKNYPCAGELTKITDVKRALGGCVPNVSVDIKTMCPEIPVYAFGRVGGDDYGRLAVANLASAGVDTKNIFIGGDETSFTTVMSIEGGERTFFTYSGANSLFSADDVKLDGCDISMLHLGYFLLLDKIDGGDGLKILKNAKRLGIKTSIDLVSERGERYKDILPCLKYVDNLIINEIEAANLAGLSSQTPLKEVAERLKSFGVAERVIIHKPDCAVCLSDEGFCASGSYILPDGYAKGSTGAGDAFCAGALVAIYENLSNEEILGFATQAAAASLGSADAVSGMRGKDEIINLCKNFKRRNICL